MSAAIWTEPMLEILQLWMWTSIEDGDTATTCSAENRKVSFLIAAVVQASPAFMMARAYLGAVEAKSSEQVYTRVCVRACVCVRDCVRDCVRARCRPQCANHIDRPSMQSFASAVSIWHLSTRLVLPAHTVALYMSARAFACIPNACLFDPPPRPAAYRWP